jgi:hypothetical protein
MFISEEKFFLRLKYQNAHALGFWLRINIIDELKFLFYSVTYGRKCRSGDVCLKMCLKISRLSPMYKLDDFRVLNWDFLLLMTSEQTIFPISVRCAVVNPLIEIYFQSDFCFRIRCQLSGQKFKFPNDVNHHVYT